MKNLILIFILFILCGCSEKIIIVHEVIPAIVTTEDDNTLSPTSLDDIAISHLIYSGMTSVKVATEAWSSCGADNYYPEKFSGNGRGGEFRGIICCSFEDKCFLSDSNWMSYYGKAQWKI